MARGHLEMVDAVNDAEELFERDRAEASLSGWRECAVHFGIGWSGIEADLHTMVKYGERRPMCCGVLLDWEPVRKATAP